MADNPGLIQNDIDFEEEATRMREYYDAIKAQGIERADVLPPEDPLVNKGADIVKILAGDEMQTLGMSLDSNGFNWDLETAKDFWSEHPVRAAVATATSLVPMLNLATKPFREAKAAGIGAEVIKAAGLIDETVDFAKMGAKEQAILQKQAYNIAKYKTLNDKIEVLGDAAPLKDRINYKLNKWFGNKYMEDTSLSRGFDSRADWVRNTSNLLKEGGDINTYLKEAPPDELGEAIVKYYNNPSELKNIPSKYQPWAVKTADDLRNTQTLMVKEGLISEDEASHIGDIWFSTVRENTAIDLGKTSTFVDTQSGKLLKIPKTVSPSLLARKASKEEVTDKIIKQQAASFLGNGDATTALSLLKDPKFKDAANLIKTGDTKTAIKLLNTGGKIDFSPKTITVNSVFQQKLLLENYRYLRELVLNPEITKTADQIAALHPTAKKNWINLDTELDGADRLRRMVGMSKGKTVDSLGYVPKHIFKEMKSLSGGDVNFNRGASSLVQAITAIHKTVKTAFSIPTHGQNIMGNWAFLVNAGVNPFDKEFIQLQKTSAKAIWEIQQNRRATGLIESTFKNATTLPSKVGGAAINIGDELNSEELRNIVELSSISSAEGIGVLEQLAHTADDDFTGTVVKMINKTITKAKVGKINPIEMSADLYGAEDGTAKMAYYLHLRQNGMSRSAASMEVGRRLPMYHTIGGFQRTMRQAWLPWISFPSEAARILKNNLQDYPLKTAVMMQIPDLLQTANYGLAAGMGRSMTAESIQERKQQLPIWGYKPNTVMTPLQDKNGDYRAAVLDFLPYTSILPSSMSDEAPASQILPFGAGEPLPILGGLFMAATGKDPYGKEIPAKDMKQKAAIIALQFMSFVSPPIMQKYLFNATEPETGYKFLTDMGKNLNPYTEKSGDPLYDLFLNNFVGVTKMYAASPEQEISNKETNTRDLQAYRGKVAKDFSALMKSGDVETAGEKLKEIMETFNKEWGDPAMAQRKMSEWLKTHTKDLKNHPQLRGLSKEELRFRIDQLTETAAKNRSLAMQQLIEVHRQELARRGRDSRGGSVNPFSPLSLSNGLGSNIPERKL